MQYYVVSNVGYFTNLTEQFRAYLKPEGNGLWLLEFPKISFWQWNSHADPSQLTGNNYPTWGLLALRHKFKRADFTQNILFFWELTTLVLKFFSHIQTAFWHRVCLMVKHRRIKVTPKVKVCFFSLMYEVLKVTTASRFVLTLLIHSENKTFPYMFFKQIHF